MRTRANGSKGRTIALAAIIAIVAGGVAPDCRAGADWNVGTPIVTY